MLISWKLRAETPSIKSRISNNVKKKMLVQITSRRLAFRISRSSGRLMGECNITVTLDQRFDNSLVTLRLSAYVSDEWRGVFSETARGEMGEKPRVL